MKSDETKNFVMLSSKLTGESTESVSLRTLAIASSSGSTALWVSNAVDFDVKYRLFSVRRRTDRSPLYNVLRKRRHTRRLMQLDLGFQVARKEGEAVAFEFEESSPSSASPSSSSCSSPTVVSTGGSTLASRALGPSPKRKAGRKKFRETRHPVYHGVRERNGGRWVCEVREPQKKSRIWLGTFREPEMAALAHDVAAIALRGGSAQLNFPDLAGALPRARSTAPDDVRRAAAKAAEMLRPLKSSPAPLPAVSDAGESQGREAREENTATKDAAAPPAAVFVDEEELFNMPELIEDMARGLLLTPPALQWRGFDWDIAVEEEQEISLWPLWNHE
ncbi:dehydration-responsive element-binding protein 1F-like [Musa acuminata AAA Group]|uniref:dehydration-responsive element-binding protein 1F-like n=1 Tax=Musa acuminata AAA Group TaxID=214697 RepID=UPI0031CE5D51